MNKSHSGESQKYGETVEKLYQVIEAERKNNGLIDFRMFVAANKDRSVDAIAADSLAMNAAYTSGKYEVVYRARAH